MADERRQHNRAPVDWSARIGGKGIGVVPARIQDASIGGVYLVTTLIVELGDNVLVELPITTAAGEKLALTHGKIARKQVLNGGKVYGYGVQFLKVDNEILMYLLSVCT
jgi:Tfp pilus assembly protein PilZ